MVSSAYGSDQQADSDVTVSVTLVAGIVKYVYFIKKTIAQHEVKVERLHAEVQKDTPYSI